MRRPAVRVPLRLAGRSKARAGEGLGSPPTRPRPWRPAGGLPEVAGQGLRYAISGAVVAVVYLATTTFLAAVVGLPFEVALPIGSVLAVCVHFTLQRLFVWVHHQEFALPLHHQVRRYLVLAGAQYATTAATTALLPAALGLPTEVVYLLTALALATGNFLVFRSVVFHPETGR